TLTAEHGRPLQRIAEDVRAAVYAAVDELTGLHVIEVNIEIADVCAPEVPEQAVPGPVVPEMPSRAPLAGAAGLGWAALTHGLGGFLLMAVFLAVGMLVGRFLDGRLDMRRVRDALTGRRSSS
ncbi:MAG: Asp23/Gls24 family envelope stress response protein, partial [Micrococcaceae bacterium]|nr:Asp23/Gls24 family envelope stress response protein [Micrococcaceae bacterium]